MTTGGLIVVIVVAVIVLALVAWFVVNQSRSRHLRQRFGPEYDRALEESGDRRSVERELTQREKRHARLDIKPLSTSARQHYEQQWALIQSRFVDDPATAVTEADNLVAVVMGERGYPTDGDYEQRVSDLSVRHGNSTGHYRAAHDINAGREDGPASTEDLREAMVHYRELFKDLLESDVDDRANAGRRA
jgi:hypothetical protein